MSARARVVVALGFLLHLAIGVGVLVSGLIMPPAAVVGLGVAWVAALGAAIRWRRRPQAVIAVPFVMLAIWLVTVWIGDAFLGWTA